MIYQPRGNEVDNESIRIAKNHLLRMASTIDTSDLWKLNKIFSTATDLVVGSTSESERWQSFGKMMSQSENRVAHGRWG
jgi:hypothetical protein